MFDDKKILREVSHTPGDGHADFLFWCPACKCGHGVWTTGKNPSSAIWQFNGNMEKPTFKPSLKIVQETWEPPVTPENMEQYHQKPWPQTKKTHVCHSVVTDGVISYCADCTHELAGKNIPMEPF